jgi:hypothetical protein
VRALGSNEDNSGNSNCGGHMQQSIKRGSRKNMAAVTVTVSGNDCDNSNEGSHHDAKRIG